jgi:N-acetylglucosaminyl-diphospho-decaprenol L-rhamnosyltransferase
MDLSIIIVSWNVSDLLQKCLQSVLDSPDTNTLSMEIIVVDSGSTDNTVAMLQERYPGVNLLTQSENVGYTRGNNIGLEAAQGRYLLLLNPDTEIIGDALVNMVTYLDENPSVGIVGPHTLNSDGTTQSSRRRFLTRTLAFFESTWLQPYAPQSLLDYFYVNGESDNGVFDVDWVQGSALMARREIYEQIGGLDTGYVMYCEEMDWCKRAKDAGWRVVYLGTAQLTHHGGKSTDQAGARKHIYFQESKLRYCRKNFGSGFAFMLRLFLLVSYVWQIGREGIRYLVGHKRPMRQERIRTYWQVLRSGLKVT